MTDTLRPCPFCGGEAEYCHAGRAAYAWISCVNCLASQPDVKAWNHRPIEDELTAENIRLKETVTRLNRRCQLAESAVNDCMKIKEGNIHAFSIGRGLLAYDLDNERRENEKLTARIAELEAEDHPRTLTSLKWRKIKN